MLGGKSLNKHTKEKEIPPQKAYLVNKRINSWGKEEWPEHLWDKYTHRTVCEYRPGPQQTQTSANSWQLGPGSMPFLDQPSKSTRGHRIQVPLPMFLLVSCFIFLQNQFQVAEGWSRPWPNVYRCYPWRVQRSWKNPIAWVLQLP